MKYVLSLFVTVLISFQSVFSQTVLKGKVIAETSILGEVYITNLTNNKRTIADNEGLFSIEAKPSHVLIFSGIKVDRKEITLKKLDFEDNLFLVKLIIKTNQLEEVEVKNYPKINAVSLGIISKNVKTYTPAERKLIAESSGIGITQFINAINGRTKELKKNVEIEKKEKLLEKLASLFDDEFYIKTLKIPFEYIKGFQVFVIDDEKIVASLKSKNKKMTGFLLGPLSLKYNDLLKNENK